ncbi:MAG: 16S rRNA (cytidine(1402)-2'-O)-methyltransferase [Bacteroidota bacterium]|nr:16S rRNA (cytidine(1402)-2'-O)-methyltransferase [Bacteroidota bacterium]
MLFIVPTPIGNLDDITLRALTTLSQCGVILAEDTRTSRVLMQHHKIDVKLRSYHQHNEHFSTEHLVKEIAESEFDFALISDAGTPGISDPAYMLVKSCLELGVKVSCLPGATAFVPALVMSGLPITRFVFEGFLPQKKGRKKKWEMLKSEARTIVLYESPHRIIRALGEMKETFGGERLINLSREISKKFEESVTGTIDELIEVYKTKVPKGEYVVVINGLENSIKPNKIKENAE